MTPPLPPSQRSSRGHFYTIIIHMHAIVFILEPAKELTQAKKKKEKKKW